MLREPQNAICGSSSVLQMYGSRNGVRDLLIENSNTNTNYFSSSDLVINYKHPNYPQGSDEADSFLAGSRNLKTHEIEMYCKQA